MAPAPQQWVYLCRGCGYRTDRRHRPCPHCGGSTFEKTKRPSPLLERGRPGNLRKETASANVRAPVRYYRGNDG